MTEPSIHEHPAMSSDLRPTSPRDGDHGERDGAQGRRPASGHRDDLNDLDDGPDAPPRRITATGALAIVVGSMLGVGIFLNPTIVAQHSTSAGVYLAMWLLGGLIALCGATAFAELGAMIPRSGGEYAFLQRAFGNSVSVAAGWTLVLVIFPGSIAAMAVAVSDYQLLPLLAAAGVLDPEHVPPGAATLIARTLALVIVAGFTLTNWQGAHVGARTQTALTVVPLVLFAIFAVTGIILFDPAPLDPSAPLHPAATSPTAPGAGPLAAFSVSFMAVYFAYSGWNAVAYAAGEVDRPGRNVPLGLVGGTLAVTALYLTLGYFFLHVLGMDGLREAGEAGSVTAVAVFGDAARTPVTLLIAIAVLSSINGTVLGGARVGFALARDGLLPRRLARLSPRTGVPGPALLFQAIVSVALVLTGTFEQLLQLTSATMLIIGTAAVLALFVLRIREPDTPRPYRVPLYPLPPLVYVAFSLFVIGWMLVSAVVGIARHDANRLESTFVLLGILVFFAVVLAHAMWHRLARTRAQAPRSGAP